jgi:peptide/nickel transport system permease protein
MRRLPWAPIGLFGAIVLLAVAAPLMGLRDPVAMDVGHRLAGPSAAFWLGQDEFGRDVLSRLIWGARVSLTVAVAASALACLAGTALGIAGGYLRGLVEIAALRSIDVLLCFPPLLLALLVVTLLGPGAATLVPVLALVYLPGFTRVAYAGVLTARSQDYVEAVRVLGATGGRIMLRTILPNIGGPVLVQFSLAMASAVVLESGLSFLGLGVVPPSPSWGLMIGAARATMAQAPLLLLWPCLALTATVLVMNALCDGLRDAVDPHPGYRRPPAHRLLEALAPGLLPAERAVLDLRGLTVEIGTPQGKVRPVRDVSLMIRPGETLALVGESGSGKSLTALAVAGLLPGAARVAEGVALLEGTDLLRLPEERLRALRGSRIAMVFQDPGSSLNPVHTVGAQIAEAIRAHRPLSAAAAWNEAERLMGRVGIPDPARRLRAYPHELSGGMRQRVMIAIAIANDPALLIADEPTTALDVTIQAQVLELLADLRRERGLGLLFITHSLPVVAEIADHVAVMYAGEIVEGGPTAEVFARPFHPYTRALLESAPVEDGPAPKGIPGNVPAPVFATDACPFAPRCALREDACEAAHPALLSVAPGRQSRCRRWEAA